MASAGLEALHESANAAFKNRDFEHAAKLYTAAIPLCTSDAKRSVLLSNRAACHLSLEHLTEAVADASASADADPLNAKAYARLARALRSSDVAKAGSSFACALALGLTWDDAATKALYAELSSRPEARLPSIPNSIHLVDSTTSPSVLDGMLSRGGTVVVVLKPGVYHPMHARTRNPSPEGGDHLTLIGLGSLHAVSVRALATQHTFYVTDHGDVALINVHLTSVATNKVYSVVAVRAQDPRGPAAQLVLRDCVIDDAEGGILVLGTASNLKVERCSIRNIVGQAIEVREGGTLTVDDSTVAHCWRAISAYGGARHVHVRNSAISDCSDAGLNLHGSETSAVVDAFESAAAQKRVRPSFVGPEAESVAEQAAEWAKTGGMSLTVSIDGCTIEKCGEAGVWIEHGANVTVHRCTFRNNRSSHLLIQRGSNLMCAANVIHVSKDEVGISQGYNLQGEVAIANNAFVYSASKDSCIRLSSDVEAGTPAEVRLLGQMRDEIRGLWSRPVSQIDNLFIPAARSASTTSPVPTTDQLAAAFAASSKHRALQLQNTDGADEINRTDERASNRLLQELRPSRRLLVDFDSDYYAIGNTLGFDICAASDSATIDTAEGTSGNATTYDLLFAASGDPRNILATVAGCMGRHPGCKLRCVVNDLSIAVLARNMLLLVLAEASVDAETVAAVWGSIGLTSSQHDALHSALLGLASGEWPSWLLLPEGASRTRSTLQAVFRAWSTCSLSADDIQRMRMERTTSIADTVNLSADAIQSQQAGQNLSVNQEDELRTYASTVTLPVPASTGSAGGVLFANATLLDAPSLQYRLYWSSSIYRAVQLGALAPVGKSTRTLHQRLVAGLSTMLASTRTALSSGSVQIALLPGDVIQCLTFSDFKFEAAGQAPPSAVASGPIAVSGFDAIDASNVADYVSLPALVQVCTPLLRPAQHARIHAQSMQWRGKEAAAASAGSFMRRAIGMDPAVFGALLGLQATVAVPQLGKAGLPGKVLTTTWSWTPSALARWKGSGTERSTSTDVTPQQFASALQSAAELQCRVKRDVATDRLHLMTATAGVMCSSAGTLAHLLVLSQPDTAAQHIERLCDTSAAAARHRSELVTLAAVALADGIAGSRSCAKVCRVAFKPDVDIFAIRLAAGAPLKVVLTPSLITSPDTRIPESSIVAAWDSIAFDAEDMKVSFLVLGTELERLENRSKPSLHLSLCNCADPLAVAMCASVPLSTAERQEVDASTMRRWRGWAQLRNLTPCPSIEVSTTAAAESTSTAAASSSCDGPGCPNTAQANGKALMVCSRCHKASYCSAECHKAGWKAGHKQACRASS